MNKEQFQKLKALLASNLSSTETYARSQEILGTDIRNPSQAAKLLTVLKLGEAGYVFANDAAIVTVAGGEGRDADAPIALLKAIVAAVEEKAIAGLLGSPKKSNPENTKTPERGSVMMQGRR